MIDRRTYTGVALALALVAPARAAFAQVDPLLLMKTEKPNIVFVVDTDARMQRGAPTDPTNPTTTRATSDYYDTNIYTRNAASPLWETSLGVTALMPTYRRLYKNLDHNSNGNGDKHKPATNPNTQTRRAHLPRFFTFFT